GSGEDFMMERIWVHPKVPGIRINALRNVEWSGDEMVANPDVVRAYYWRADWGYQEFENISLKAIADVAGYLVTKYEEKETENEGTIVDSVVQMLKPLGWVVTDKGMVVPVPGRWAVTLEHPKVAKKIRVTYEKESGDVKSVMMVSSTGVYTEALQPTLENIYKVAQAFMKEAGA
ncbi:MAG: hypothetical protein KAJ19_09540, partial [Gammaproteobacteria bacterium]|nr:hypothetical protein [Gammaproteobacteria bacterium]